MAKSRGAVASLAPNGPYMVRDEGVFAQWFRGHEGPYHLYDSGDRPLIRAETGAHVLGALLEKRSRLVFVDDPGCEERSVLRMAYPAREWLATPVEPKACSCGDGRCRGRLVIMLHETHAGPNWTLTYRG
jgi:hypothetical protein